MLLPVFIVYLMPNLLSLPLPFLHNNIHYLKADTPPKMSSFFATFF